MNGAHDMGGEHGFGPVVPERPAGTDGWSEEQLADLVTRDSMIGTGLATTPESAA